MVDAGSTSDVKKYAMFLGCTVSVRGLNYELSAKKVAQALGVEIVDLPGFSCCGFPLEALHHHSAMTLAARNLAIAEKEGLDILALCSACTGSLTKAQKYLTENGGGKELMKVNEDLEPFGYEYKGGAKVKHFCRFLFEDIGLDKLKESITNPLEGMKIAPHYGCHYMKPSEIFDGFDDPINPQSLDKLIEVTGAESVQYRDKLQCCGGGILAVDEGTAIKMVKQKLDHVKDAQADAIVLMCPFCSIMYDEYQLTVEAKFEAEYGIPVLYYPQLLGLAMGMDPKKELATKKNVVKVKPFLKKLKGTEE